MPKAVEPAALVVSCEPWLLDRPQQDLLLRLTPGAFDNDKAAWGLALAEVYFLRGEKKRTEEHAEEARRALVQHLAEAPNSPDLHVGLGRALAYLGRGEEACCRRSGSEVF